MTPLNPEITYQPDWLPAAEATRLLETLLAQTHWQQGTVRLFGKTHPEPRLSAWYGEVGYRYAGRDLLPQPWPDALHTVRARLQEAFRADWNGVLLNYYRNGRDYMGFHADNEPELGPRPQIVSLSLGAERRFVLQHRQSGQRHTLWLTHGSLLYMYGRSQLDWRHALPKALRVHSARLNLTFRALQRPDKKFSQGL